MKNRILSLLLVMLMLSGMLYACAEKKGSEESKEEEEEKQSSAQTTTEEVIIDVNSILASLPEANYEGYEFKIWTSNWANPTTEIRQAPEEAENGEPVNDALYRRDRLVEAKYNIKIKYDINNEVFDQEAKAKKSVMAGDNAFDYVLGDMQNITKTLAQTGLIYDFNVMPNVDLDKSWWSKYATRDLTIGGKFYFPTGDITPRYIKAPYLLMFNKEMFADNGIEFPYQKVYEGKWTIDALLTIIKDHGKDLNNDGKFDLEDAYGLTTEGMTALCFMKGFNESIVKIENGNPIISMGNEKSLAMIQKLADMMASNDAYVDPQYRSYFEGPVFTEKRTLILGQTAGNLPLFRDVEFDYGILPMPKLDENQTNYACFAQPWAAVAVAVPKTNPDIARTGMIIEALAAAGKYTSTPAEFEVTLKTKFTRDAESANMLDIICQTACYDFGMIYNWGNCYNVYIDSINKQIPFVSSFEKIKDKMKAEIDKTVAIFEEVKAE